MAEHHTPGPWEYDGKFQVGIPHKKGWTGFRTNPEDARLIAAAPELLKALKEAVAYADMVGREEGMPDGKQSTRVTATAIGAEGVIHAVFDVKAARAAIAKATSASDVSGRSMDSGTNHPASPTGQEE